MRIRNVFVLLIVFVVTTPVAGEAAERPRTTFPPAPDRPIDESLSDTVTPPGDEPVVVVAGWGALPTDVWYWPLYVQLWGSGYDPSDIHPVFFGYVPFGAVDSPTYNAGVLADNVESILQNSSDTKVDVIAHSMGGLASRWYVEKMDGADHVDDLVLMGTPHQGNYVSYLFSFTGGGRAMHPGSRFYSRLDTDVVSPSVDYHNVWSVSDDFYVDRYNAKLPETVVESRSNVHQTHLPVVPHLLLPAWSYGSYVDELD